MLIWEAFVVIFLLPLAAMLFVTFFLKGIAALNWGLDPTVRRQQGFWATVWNA